MFERVDGLVLFLVGGEGDGFAGYAVLDHQFHEPRSHNYYQS